MSLFCDIPMCGGQPFGRKRPTFRVIRTDKGAQPRMCVRRFGLFTGSALVDGTRWDRPRTGSFLPSWDDAHPFLVGLVDAHPAILPPSHRVSVACQLPPMLCIRLAVRRWKHNAGPEHHLLNSIRYNGPAIVSFREPDKRRDEGATTPKWRLPASLFAFMLEWSLSHSASAHLVIRGCDCLERVLQPSRIGPTRCMSSYRGQQTNRNR
jgi:hypothetical protein